MIKRHDSVQDYPLEIRSGNLSSILTHRREELYFALRGLPAAQTTLRVVWTLPDEGIAVIEGDPQELAATVAGQQVRPVYRRQPNGPVEVPTGLVFARFEEGVKAEERRAHLADAGYDIESIPSYAPHCAWLRASDGQLSSALLSIPALLALPDMANVEPQMLSPRPKR